MGVPSGLLNKRVRLLRRAPMPTTNTGVRGTFVPYGADGYHWGGYRPRASTEVRIGGMTLAAVTGVLTLRDNPDTRALGIASRVEIDGAMYEIMGQQVGEIVDGALRFDVRSAPTKDAYAREMDTKGDAVVVRRVLTGGSTQDGIARAIVTGFQPEEIAGGIVYGERRVMLFADDLIAQNWPVPPRVNDRILIQGGTRNLNILTVDDETHRFAGELFAYEIRAAG